MIACQHVHIYVYAFILSLCLSFRIHPLSLTLSQNCRKDHWAQNKEWWRQQLEVFFFSFFPFFLNVLLHVFFVRRFLEIWKFYFGK